MSAADKLRAAHAKAVARIEKIGRPESHFSPVSYGELTSVKVTTTIGHQEYSGATNYWNDEEFDAALAVVIKRQFAALSEAAILLMRMQADAALVSEKATLLKRLEQIAAIEAGAAA